MNEEARAHIGRAEGPRWKLKPYLAGPVQCCQLRMPEADALLIAAERARQALRMACKLDELPRWEAAGLDLRHRLFGVVGSLHRAAATLRELGMDDPVVLVLEGTSMSKHSLADTLRALAAASYQHEKGRRKELNEEFKDWAFEAVARGGKVAHAWGRSSNDWEEDRPADDRAPMDTQQTAEALLEEWGQQVWQLGQTMVNLTLRSMLRPCCHDHPRRSWSTCARSSLEAPAWVAIPSIRVTWPCCQSRGCRPSSTSACGWRLWWWCPGLSGCS